MSSAGIRATSTHNRPGRGAQPRREKPPRGYVEPLTYRAADGTEVTREVISVDAVLRELILLGRGDGSLKQFSRRIGFPYSSLHAFVSGETARGQLRLLTAVAGAAGQSPLDALRQHPALQAHHEQSLAQQLLSQLAAQLTLAQLRDLAQICAVLARDGHVDALLESARPWAARGQDGRKVDASA